MTNIVPTVETSPVGRHGRIDVDIFPRDIEYPSFDRPYVEQAMAVVATKQVETSQAEAPKPTVIRAVAQKSTDPYVEIWR